MKLRFSLLIPIVAVATLAAAQAQQATPAAAPAADDLPDAPTANVAVTIQPNGPMVVMDTSMGRITCQFYQKQAPATVCQLYRSRTGDQRLDRTQVKKGDAQQAAL